MTELHTHAFPSNLEGYQPQKGLTKREYFAALAMQALVASGDEGAGDRLVDLPEYAVNIADALIDALNNPKNEQ